LKISVKPSEKYGMAEKQIFDMPILGEYWAGINTGYFR
jgi:hypothetical protein